MTLTDNEWCLLNELIFKINSISDLDEMRYAFMEFLKLLIPYDMITFYLADPEKYMGSPIVIGGDYEIINSYLDDLGQIDPKRWIFLSGQNKAFRESDLLSEELRSSHMYYIRAYRPLNIHYGAILSLAYNNKFVGVVSLYRPSNKTDFSDRDIFVLDALKKHLALRLYKDIYQQEHSEKKRDSFLLVFTERYHLSDQESQIVSYLINGETNESISEKLFISTSTLKKHISNIYKKTNVKSRGEFFHLVMKERENKAAY